MASTNEAKPMLWQLPDELLSSVLELLPFPDITTLAKTCQQVRQRIEGWANSHAALKRLPRINIEKDLLRIENKALNPAFRLHCVTENGPLHQFIQLHLELSRGYRTKDLMARLLPALERAAEHHVQDVVHADAEGRFSGLRDLVVMDLTHVASIYIPNEDHPAVFSAVHTHFGVAEVITGLSSITAEDYFPSEAELRPRRILKALDSLNEGKEEDDLVLLHPDYTSLAIAKYVVGTTKTQAKILHFLFGPWEWALFSAAPSPIDTRQNRAVIWMYSDAVDKSIRVNQLEAAELYGELFAVGGPWAEENIALFLVFAQHEHVLDFLNGQLLLGATRKVARLLVACAAAEWRLAPDHDNLRICVTFYDQLMGQQQHKDNAKETITDLFFKELPHMIDDETLRAQIQSAVHSVLFDASVFDTTGA